MSDTKYVVVSTAQPREATKSLLLLFEAEADHYHRVFAIICNVHCVQPQWYQPKK